VYNVIKSNQNIAIPLSQKVMSQLCRHGLIVCWHGIMTFFDNKLFL